MTGARLVECVGSAVKLCWNIDGTEKREPCGQRMRVAMGETT